MAIQTVNVETGEKSSAKPVKAKGEGKKAKTNGKAPEKVVKEKEPKVLTPEQEAAKAERERRAAMTMEEREAEDKAKREAERVRREEERARLLEESEDNLQETISSAPVTTDIVTNPLDAMVDYASCVQSMRDAAKIKKELGFRFVLFAMQKAAEFYLLEHNTMHGFVTDFAEKTGNTVGYIQKLNMIISPKNQDVFERARSQPEAMKMISFKSEMAKEGREADLNEFANWVPKGKANQENKPATPKARVDNIELAFVDIQGAIDVAISVLQNRGNSMGGVIAELNAMKEQLNTLYDDNFAPDVAA